MAKVCEVDARTQLPKRLRLGRRRGRNQDRRLWLAGRPPSSQLGNSTQQGEAKRRSEFLLRPNARVERLEECGNDEPKEKASN